MKNFKSLGFYAALILLLLLVVSLLFSGTGEKRIKYSQVLEHFENREVYYFEINDNILDVQLLSGEKYSFTLYDPYLFLADVSEDIDQAKEDGKLTGYDLTPPEPTPFWLSFLPYLLFGVVILLFWFFMMNQMNGGGKAMSFGKARLKTNDGQKKKVTFDDVAGADEEKEELTEVVEFLKNPKKYTDMGAHIPRGILLVGPPGTGKTYLAKAASGEAGVPFFSISGSDFVELYVGVGASRVRDTFDQAKKNAPCIVFIDEIDAVGRQRGAGLGGGHDEREQTLNQLLVEMDGFEENEGVIVMAATNRPDILDNALLRPGRFDRQIVINLPDVKAREAVLKIHAKNKPIDADVDLSVIAKTTAGFSPADLQNILNEGALLAARRKRDKIKMVDIEDAILKVVVGVEKKSRIVTEKEKRLTSYHEGGHAIINKVLVSQGPVHQISIIPRGMAGGFTLSLPQEDKNYMSKNEMFEEIVSLLGGRVAEALCLDDISTGASNDIQRATAIAKKMVTKYGMSDRLGPIDFGGHEEVFLGRDFTSQRSYSEETAAEIDREVKSIVDRAYENAKQILEDNRNYLEQVASILMEKEKMSAEEFYGIFGEPAAVVPENV
ncbi:MAG: ATP-dependent zinc metalloprotease FtsH [Clostridia bacterium]|nr:ATP-dependent zinc metalloprotease FtsH [Clostridia bacterium]MBO5298553.1 ATP-dependent zinc metalloprotease FtsH [Clostridia bacterium]